MAFEIDPITELAHGLAPESVSDVDHIVYGEHGLTPGQMARIAAGLGQAAADLKQRAKSEVIATMPTGERLQAGVLFKWRRPFTRTNFDQKAAKGILLREQYPHLYSETEVAADLTVSVMGPADN